MAKATEQEYSIGTETTVTQDGSPVWDGRRMAPFNSLVTYHWTYRVYAHSELHAKDLMGSRTFAPNARAVGIREISCHCIYIPYQFYGAQGAHLCRRRGHHILAPYLRPERPERKSDP